MAHKALYYAANFGHHFGFGLEWEDVLFQKAAVMESCLAYFRTIAKHFLVEIENYLHCLVLDLEDDS